MINESDAMENWVNMKQLLKAINKKDTPIWILAAIILLQACMGALAYDANNASAIIIKDSANRSVEIPAIVDRMVILNYCAPIEIKALGAVDSIVGIEQYTRKKVESGLLPDLADIPVAGSQDEPNYELIAELNPDVVITFSAGWPPEPDEVSKKLEPFGIPVVGLDFYRMDIWAEEIRTLGKMLGREAEAEDYIAHFQEKLDFIENKTATLQQENRKKVYFEGVKDYFTYGGSGFGCGVPGMIRDAGGLDLYPERSEQYFEVNPEDVSKRNPDVIFKLIRQEWGKENETEFQALQESILKRPELASTNAVKNGQVYIISYDLVGDEGKKFGVIFIAKALYPEFFADLDPLTFYRDYFKDYQGTDLRGVFIYPPL